ncbi:hypothetical protein ACFE04_014027 [Oxalis oulophora]
MKLRLRSIESNETLRLELPSCPPPTLHQLQQLLFQSISPPPSSSTGLYLSFNRKDPIIAASDDDTLLSLGVTSGDLLYFSFSHSSKIENTHHHHHHHQNQNHILIDDSDTQMAELEEFVAIDDDKKIKKYEVCYLNKVLIEELGHDARDYRCQVVAAVHAGMLESGFVRIDEVSGSKAHRLQFPEAGFSSLSFRYRPLDFWGEYDESVVLKFQSLGHFVMVYGSLTKTGSSSFRLSWAKDKIAPILDIVHLHNTDQSFVQGQEKEVLEFWKMVKDELAFPLLIDLCYSIGVAFPPSLMGLPKELKLKILVSLPGVDLAKMECVCKEMKTLASDDDLWKQKCDEEFKTGTGDWKKTFARNWQDKKMEERALTRCVRHGTNGLRFFPAIRRDPHPFGAPPPMIGGNYDRYPVLGVPPPFGVPRRQFRHHNSQPFNLGGFHA